MTYIYLCNINLYCINKFQIIFSFTTKHNNKRTPDLMTTDVRVNYYENVIIICTYNTRVIDSYNICLKSRVVFATSHQSPISISRIK